MTWSLSSRRVPVARRNLLYNRRRLAAALAGVVFAVVLVNVEVGILAGFIANSSTFIDRMPADLWVMALGTRNFDQPFPISETAVQRVRSFDDVEWAETLFASWSNWKLPDGTQEVVQIIGLPEEGHLPIPWEVHPPEARRLIEHDGVIIDEAERGRLMVTEINQVAELIGDRVKVVGFTRGLRSFTTSPYVLMRFNQARRLFNMGIGGVAYVLVKAREGTDPKDLRNRLRQHLPNFDVLTRKEFRMRTWSYWLFGTGVGTGFMISALLGFCVGGAVVGQVLYAMVVEQRAEFGVLKAVGAGNGFLCRIVFGQAILIGLVGYALGFAVTIPVKEAVVSVGTPFHLFWQLIAGGFLATMTVCIGSAGIPVLKVFELEPALVFRGIR